jgi:hypothetical protein
VSGFYKVLMLGVIKLSVGWISLTFKGSWSGEPNIDRSKLWNELFTLEYLELP